MTTNQEFINFTNDAIKFCTLHVIDLCLRFRPPTALEQLRLEQLRTRTFFDGFSDHVATFNLPMEQVVVKPTGVTVVSFEVKSGIADTVKYLRETVGGNEILHQMVKDLIVIPQLLIHDKIIEKRKLDDNPK